MRIRNVPEQVVHRIPPGTVGVIQDGPYGLSRLLLHAGWAKSSSLFGGHLVVSAPSEQELLYADGSSADVVNGLSVIAHEHFFKAERPISPSVFEWRPDGWAVVAR